MRTPFALVLAFSVATGCGGGDDAPTTQEATAGAGGNSGGAGAGSAGKAGGAGGAGGAGTAGNAAKGGSSAGNGGASAGTGGAAAGSGGSSAGKGGTSAGNGGTSAGNGGTSAGNGGTSAGNGGASAGKGGAAAGNGGTSAGNGGAAAGSGGSAAGNGGTSAGNGGVAGMGGGDPLAGIGAVQTVKKGFQFLEGPVWLAGDGVLLFSDIPANKIHRLAPPSTFTVFRDPSGMSNGLGLDPSGLLLACEHANRRVTRTLADGTVVPIAETFEGKKLSSPNDVIARSDGTIYFTDPPYGIPAGQMQELPFQGLFRIDPQGTLAAEAKDMNRPNGVALSPDEQVLYVADSMDGYVRRYDVGADGALANPTKLTSTGGGGDGMAIDDFGNIYVSTTPGVLVLRPDGSAWGTIKFPEEPANCTFGDADRRTLYVTARTGLYRVKLAIPGKP